MSKTFCGACRGERGCRDCRAIGGSVSYTGLTEFCVHDQARMRSESEMSVQEESTNSCYDNVLFLAADLGTTTLAFVCADERRSEEAHV